MKPTSTLYKVVIIIFFLNFLMLGYVQTIVGYQNSSDSTSQNYINPVKVYPQPFKSDLTIDWNNNELFKKNVTVEVYDLLGQSKFEASYPEVNDKLSLDLSQLSPGIYLVSIYTPFNKQTFKLHKL